MCRHIYDWNIVNCDVKQTIQLHNSTRIHENSYSFLNMFCIQISVTFSNQTISTSIICVSVLVSSLINIQKQNMINNFHVRVQQVTRGTYVYWRTSIIPLSWRYHENHILRLISRHYLSIGSWEALLVLNKMLESWLNIRKILFIQLLSLKSY